ncbi:MAG TPA: hypothetical protein VF960_07985 [Chloroflexota bacterium]
MLRISVDNATSFARSIDEELRCPEQFFSATSQWLNEHEPVLSALSYQMGLRLSNDKKAAAVAQTVVGYMLRLMDHAQANATLAKKLEQPVSSGWTS